MEKGAKEQAQAGWWWVYRFLQCRIRGIRLTICAHVPMLHVLCLLLFVSNKRRATMRGTIRARVKRGMLELLDASICLRVPR